MHEHVSIDEPTSLEELLARVQNGGEVTIARGNEPVARLVPVARPVPYVGLYGNHPYDIRCRRRPRLPDLAPEDFED